MNIAFFNGNYIPKTEVAVSPDDRGFLFADGIYEVIKWYGRDFFDMEGHHTRLKRSLKELQIDWKENNLFPYICKELIEQNHLRGKSAMVYVQVTRGMAPRSHNFPSPPVSPTIYGFARELPVAEKKGINVIVRDDIRWSRCDIKSVALLPNTLASQEAATHGAGECIFVRNGMVTEASHSNVFFVINGTLITHPESNFILSGINRKKVIALAREAGITVDETPLPVENINKADEVFITNTTGEITPVLSIEGAKAGKGETGPVTALLASKFMEFVSHLY